MVNYLKIANIDFMITGNIIRTIRIKEEWDINVENPQAIMRAIRVEKVRADMFTFSQQVLYTESKFRYHMELDNVSALPIISYEHWWAKQANQEVRNKVRKSRKNGVVVRLVDFTDNLVTGIQEIYNETPIRQGKSFWHYGKSFDDTKEANATYLDRADFIGAYLGDELIGFLKLVYTNKYARTMGILSKIAHRDKSPMNALIAKAVEICDMKGVQYLVYGKYLYGSKGADSLTDFKRHNGFLKFDLPRYFIPLSMKGKLILALNLHKGFKEVLPRFLIRKLLMLRKIFLEK